MKEWPPGSFRSATSDLCFALAEFTAGNGYCVDNDKQMPAVAQGQVAALGAQASGRASGANIQIELGSMLDARLRPRAIARRDAPGNSSGPKELLRERELTRGPLSRVADSICIEASIYQQALATDTKTTTTTNGQSRARAHTHKHIFCTRRAGEISRETR